MGMIRAFGLIFFLTLLIGGCIIADNTPSEIDRPDPELIEVTWNAAIDFIQQGEVQSMTQQDGVLIMTLADGSIRRVILSIDKILSEELIRCGPPCEPLKEISL